MLSKNTIKLIKSLSIKKYRIKEKLFLVEGDKMVSEVLHSGIMVKQLIVTPEFNFATHTGLKDIGSIINVEHEQIKKCSLLKTPQNSIAVCQIPTPKKLPSELDEGLSLYLDGIQDPGNMGTVIRICDWFGIKNIFCSHDTVDLYNPKVIQASMGSFCRINLWYCSFNELKNITGSASTKTFGAFMEGENIYSEQLPHNAILVMGNEGNGIRPEVERLIDKRLSIPNFSTQQQKAESLNVSVATAIICSEFKRAY